VSRCVSRYQPSFADGPFGTLKLLVVRSANDAYDRLVLPMLTRGFRSVCNLFTVFGFLLKIMN